MSDSHAYGKILGTSIHIKFEGSWDGQVKYYVVSIRN